VNYFTVIPQHVEDIFKTDGILINYKKGQLFVRFEDTAQGIYLLKSGQALAYSPKNSGHDQLIGIFEEGSIFGKVGSVLPQRFINTSIQALTDCEVFRISCDKFINYLKNDVILADAYMRQVSFNNIHVLSHLIILGEKDLYTRVVKGLVMLVDYYGTREHDKATLRISLTQEQLSSLFCMTREYLNKILQELKNKKLVTVTKSGYVHVPSVKLLQEESA